MNKPPLYLILISMTCLFGFSVIQAQIVLLDDGDSGVTTSGSWSTRSESQHSGTWEDSGSRFSGNNGDTITYSSSLPSSGVWALETWQTNTLNADSSSVSFTTSGATVSPTIEQGSMNGPARDQWLSLGLYDFSSGNNSYTLTSGGDNQSSDAVRWVNMTNNLSDLTPVVVGVGGGISPDFYQETGTGWLSSGTNNGVYGAKHQLTNTVGDRADFSAPITEHQYEVQITWNTSESRSDQALFEVLDANGDTHDFRINQEVDPVGESALGVTWHSLGIFDMDESSQVSLIADADGVSGGNYVIADGVRFVAVPEPGTLMLVGIAIGTLLFFRRRK